jgi:hypothetical protein
MTAYDETCEIEVIYTTPEHAQARFWAKAMGPEGAYNAGESEDFPATQPVRATPQTNHALQGLVRQLIVEGWTTDPLHTPEHHKWFGLRFRRHVVTE